MGGIMRLKNKKTGEIIDTLNSYDCTKGISFGADHHDGDPTIESYDSLAELNKEWEDAPEEPKEYWYIDPMVCGVYFTKIKNDEDLCEFNKQIGNYFETKEEAEKAVEKLKAWKRLKGEIVGWSFSYDLDLNGCGFNDEDIVVGIKLPRNASKKDLDLLFSGEDE